MNISYTGTEHVKTGPRQLRMLLGSIRFLK